MLIRFSKKFAKHYKKASSEVKTSFDKKLNIFLQNPFHPLLNNHTLVGKFVGFRSINITGDWRAIYKGTDEIIVFTVLGTHSQLYK